MNFWVSLLLIYTLFLAFESRKLIEAWKRGARGAFGVSLVGCFMLSFTLAGSVFVARQVFERGTVMMALKKPVSDAVLGLRLPPDTPWHDQYGFRNRRVPERADIVAVGDSQTWGINALRHEAWPQQLQKISRRSVYNMGLGYYGPLQYLELMKKAVSLKPQWIVTAFYSGNDLYGAFDVAVSNPHYTRFKNILSEENRSSEEMMKRLKAINESQMRFFNNFQGPRNLNEWAGWVTRKFQILPVLYKGGFWSAVTYLWKFESHRAWALARPEEGSFYSQNGIPTILKTAYRLEALNLKNAEIRGGLEITKAAVREMKDLAESEKIQFLLLLIPTKESVYAEVMTERQMELPPVLRDLYEQETKVLKRLSDFCEQQGILYLNVLPDLKDGILKGEMLYPVSEDGHPLPRGYEIIARAVNRKIISAEKSEEALKAGNIS